MSPHSLVLAGPFGQEMVYVRGFASLCFCAASPQISARILRPNGRCRGNLIDPNDASNLSRRSRLSRSCSQFVEDTALVGFVLQNSQFRASPNLFRSVVLPNLEPSKRTLSSEGKLAVDGTSWRYRHI